ncbi:MAG: hydrogenase maturation nickel metallochaperone HypA [Bryobacteraceae bacterium]
MHELTIATSILEHVESLAALQPGECYAAIHLRIGDVSGIEPEALRFGLALLARERGWPPLELHCHTVPVSRRCRECGAHSEAIAASCSQCGGCALQFESGAELEIVSVDVEQAA